METLETRLEGPILLRPTVHADERGFFQETYRRSAYAELGIGVEFVQDNHSRSRRGVLRGMHFSIGRGMSKLVRCGSGANFDVMVDIRRGSPTFGQWEAFELDDENLHQLYCPIGFAHGFCVTSERGDVLYKCSEYYGGKRAGLCLRRSGCGIRWPDLEITLSARDASASSLREISDEIPFAYRAEARPA
jgi:dTDP-4-dehydrorhamnose 3,5-epimerase